MRKILTVLLTFLIGMLLCGGVASAAGNCCVPGLEEGDPCYCVAAINQTICEVDLSGIWVSCDIGTNEPCDHYCTSGGECVPEASTVALLAVGLIGVIGYFGLAGRKKE